MIGSRLNSPHVAVAPDDRLSSIDCLRGLALFGVLAINLETEFRVSMFTQFIPAAANRGLDGLIDAVLIIFLQHKGLALFSLLFGVGLAIQFERLATSGRRAILLVRRLLALLAFGLFHMIFIWNGDILTEYALAGMVVVPLLYCGPTWLAVGAAGFFALYLLLQFFPGLVPFPDAAWLRRHVAAAVQTYGSGDYSEVLKFRIRELPAILPLHLYIFPRTLALMLLGAIFWQMGLFKPVRKPGVLPTVSGALIASGLVLTLGTTAGAYSSWWQLAVILGAALAPVILATGYLAVILVAYRLGHGRHGPAWIESLGRMAFTNYVVQSVVLGFIFYGYGLGLFGKLSLTEGLVFVMVLYITQSIASHLWLKRFRYGPLEWLWRTATYGFAPPFLRSTS